MKISYRWTNTKTREEEENDDEEEEGNSLDIYWKCKF
jgi:hypothetical protein